MPILRPQVAEGHVRVEAESHPPDPGDHAPLGPDPALLLQLDFPSVSKGKVARPRRASPSRPRSHRKARLNRGGSGRLLPFWAAMEGARRS
jgi:hypothetical protein